MFFTIALVGAAVLGFWGMTLWLDRHNVEDARRRADLARRWERQRQMEDTKRCIEEYLRLEKEHNDPRP